MKHKPALNTELLRSKLKLKHLTSQTLLVAHHPKVKRLLVSGALAGSLLLAPPQATPVASMKSSELSLVSTFDLQNAMKVQLAEVLPNTVQPLNSDQEATISAGLKKIYGLEANAELDGNRLNTDYGYIGVEQHLPRFPGDFRDNTTPGRGAWGYFAASQELMTPDLVQKEKYYVAVQTLYLPDWTTRLAYLRDWYRYRKVVVVNPRNGKAIVADIADSGPAWWTGKSYGGSPEVMQYLDLHDGKGRGAVVLFFVNDPNDSVPLGPLENNLQTGPAQLAQK